MIRRACLCGFPPPGVWSASRGPSRLGRARLKVAPQVEPVTKVSQGKAHVRQALADPRPSDHVGGSVSLSFGSAGSRSEAGTSPYSPAEQAWVPVGTRSASCAPRAASCWWTSSTSTMLAKSTVAATTPNACARAAKPATRFAPLCPLPGVGVEGEQGQGQALLMAEVARVCPPLLPPADHLLP